MKYRCLVVDFDNTVAQTIPDLQYPAFRSMHEKWKLGECPEMDEYLRIDFEIGSRGYFREVSPENGDAISDDFMDFISTMKSYAYDGIKEVFEEYVDAGGEIHVASNSYVDIVERSWRENGLPAPKAIYGWNHGEEFRKPNSASLESVYSATGYRRGEILVLDDRLSGITMAKKLETPCAVAGWGLVYGKGLDWMKENSGADYFFATVKEFGSFLLERE